MEFERTAEQARLRALECASLLEGAESAASRRFYQHLYESWVHIANMLEVTEAARASRAMQLSWAGERA